MVSKQLSGILQEAAAREVASYRMYQRAAEMVEDNEARDALARLAEMEKAHERKLADLAAGTTEILQPDQVDDIRVSEFLVEQELAAQMDLTDVLAYAIKKEERAWRFYTHLASAIPEGETKTLLETLAKEELSHKNKIEQFYEAVLDQRIPYRHA